MKAIVTIFKSMNIVHMNTDHRQGPIGLTKAIIMHLTMYVPNVTSLDIQAKIVGPKCQHQIIITPRVKEKWTMKKQGYETNLEEKGRRWK